MPQSDDCMAKVLSALDEQKKTMTDLSMRVGQLEINVQPPGYPPINERRRPLQFAEDLQPVWYKCGIVGHIGRQCQDGQMWGNGQHPGGRQRNASHPDVPRSGNSLNETHHCRESGCGVIASRLTSFSNGYLDCWEMYG